MQGQKLIENHFCCNGAIHKNEDLFGEPLWLSGKVKSKDPGFAPQPGQPLKK
jgi:hypothetical protein